MDFLYFLPDQKRKPGDCDEQIKHALQDTRCVGKRRTNSGPGNTSGLIIGPNRESPVYKPEIQKWVEWNGFWLGYEKEDKPKPDDLKKKQMIQGRDVELADGNKWLIPVARRWTDESGTPLWASTLERTLIMDKDGNMRFGDVMGYAKKLWDLSEHLAETIFGAIEDSDNKEPDVTIQDEYKIAAEILEVNYRVGIAEVSALELFTKDKFSDIFFAVIDFDGFLEITGAHQKKNVTHDNSSNTDSGSTDAANAMH